MTKNPDVGTIWQYWQWPPSKEDWEATCAREDEYQRKRDLERAERSWWNTIADWFAGL
jgi:hypothetical protein